jgi:hypothetical protein
MRVGGVSGSQSLLHFASSTQREAPFSDNPPQLHPHKFRNCRYLKILRTSLALLSLPRSLSRFRTVSRSGFGTRTFGGG